MTLQIGMGGSSTIMMLAKMCPKKVIRETDALEDVNARSDTRLHITNSWESTRNRGKLSIAGKRRQELVWGASCLLKGVFWEQNKDKIAVPE
jgi:hypothetical protein